MPSCPKTKGDVTGPTSSWRMPSRINTPPRPCPTTIRRRPTLIASEKLAGASSDFKLHSVMMTMSATTTAINMPIVANTASSKTVAELKLRPFRATPARR